MKKRGSMLVFIAMISVVISVFIFLIMPQIAKAYVSGKLALKVAAARDIALVLDTMYSYPYDMVLEYDVDLSDFIVEVSQKTVKIKMASQTVDPIEAKYGFVPINDDPAFTLLKPKKIIFKKENGKITAYS